ncbi:hypothetical protein CEXT_85991 [Caerostris extrusa]|uniref:Uncharacterized protein n=1 Tax=Caerostris extrusa TaxID=172846 RepID=A0AAV4Y2F2_CAEEX|nr:hypothetical protein CEXT_85991 [Caerostris extrusa]
MDGAPIMKGKKERLLFDEVPLHNTPRKLCGKVLKVEHVMQIIFKTVNFMRARGLSHCHFQKVLKSLDVEYGYHKLL